MQTPSPRYNFPGLKEGDNWCVCVYRWVQAKRDGHAPPVVLASTNLATLGYLREFNMNLQDLNQNIHNENQTLNSCNNSINEFSS